MGGGGRKRGELEREDEGEGGEWEGGGVVWEWGVGSGNWQEGSRRNRPSAAVL